MFSSSAAAALWRDKKYMLWVHCEDGGRIQAERWGQKYRLGLGSKDEGSDQWLIKDGSADKDFRFQRLPETGNTKEGGKKGQNYSRSPLQVHFFGIKRESSGIGDRVLDADGGSLADSLAGDDGVECQDWELARSRF